MKFEANTSVLIVDDDDMSSLLMSAILARHALSCQVASNVKEALSKVKTNDFDLILTDINMPGMNGFDLVRAIHESSEKKEYIPVVAVTSDIYEDDIEKYRQSSFAEVLLKPYEEEDLLNVITRCLHELPLSAVKPAEKEPLPGNTSLSFNVDQLNRIGDNNEEFVEKMLKKFIETASECSESINSALVSKNREKLRAAAHKGIPSYSLMGLKDMVDYLKFIELNVRSDFQHSAIAVTVKLLTARNNEIISDIKQYLHANKEVIDKDR